MLLGRYVADVRSGDFANDRTILNRDAAVDQGGFVLVAGLALASCPGIVFRCPAGILSGNGATKLVMNNDSIFRKERCSTP